LQARASVCTSNIRQICVVTGESLNDNDGRFPCGFDSDILGTNEPPEGYSGNGQGRSALWWFDLLGGIYKKYSDKYYEQKHTIVACPAKQSQNIRIRTDVLCGNYGVNMSICKTTACTIAFDMNEFGGEPLTIAEVPHASKTLLIVDSGYAIISWRHAADTFQSMVLGSNNIEKDAYIPGLSINKSRTFLTPGQELDAIGGRHPRKTVNVGYADGHVSRVPAEDLLVKKRADGGYDNLVPLWRPR
jgi:prepilin-type processing-associated H-X9-DG protein